MDGTRGPPRRLSTREKWKAVGVVALFAVAISFGIALFSGSIPGLPASHSSTVTFDGRSYYYYGYFLPFPQLGTNSTPPASVVFHNVTFWVWITDWLGPHGTYVHGNGTEPNGTTYAFLLGESPTNGTRTMSFVAPDGSFATVWGGGYMLELLVEAPKST